MNQLIVIVLYEANNRLTRALFESICASQYEHIDIKLSTAGTTHKIITSTLVGSWHQLRHFKTRFSIIQEKYPISAMVKDITPTAYTVDSLPYEAYLTTPANPAALYQTIQFFLNLPIDLHHLSTSTYQAPITKTDMLEIRLLLIATPGCSINDYRENILQFCDENHFELILEPKKS